MAHHDLGSRVAPVLFVAASVVIGFDLVRLLVPSVMAAAGAPLAWGSSAVPAALVWVMWRRSTSPVTRPGAPPVASWLGVAMASGLAAARLAVQLPLDGGVRLVSAATGVACFVALLAFLVARAPAVLPAGLVLGVALDAAAAVPVKTLRVLWIDTWWAPVAVAAVLVAFVLVAARGAGGAGQPGPLGLRPAVIGPFVALEVAVLANPGWVARAVDVDVSAAAGLAAVAAATGALVGLWPHRSPDRAIPPTAAVVLASLLLVALGTGPWVLGGLFGAQVGLARTLRHAVAAGTPPRWAQRARRPRWLAIQVLGAVAGAAVVASYAAAASTSGPWRGEHVVIATGAAIALAGTTTRDTEPSGPSAIPLLLTGAMFTLLTVSVAVALPDRPGPESRPSASHDGRALRVATFNMHRGFTSDGRMDLEATASAIAATGADIVGLQEVARGSVLDGSVDTLAWLAERLGYRYVLYAPVTSDELVGNALLSRIPVQELADPLLPSDRIPRGALAARLRPAGPEGPLIVVTHLDTDRATARTQAATLAEHLQGHGPTILLGDLNTRADTATMDVLAAAGLHPVDAGAGTFPADDPTTQVDWVLHTGDLAATGVGVVTTSSSDHLPVVAVLEKRPRPAT